VQGDKVKHLDPSTHCVSEP